MQLLFHEDLDYVEVKLYDNGIFHVHHKGKMPLTLQQAKTIYNLKEKITVGTDLLILSTSSTKFNMPTKEAAKFIQLQKEATKTIASAYVASTFPQRLAIKAVFFIKKMQRPIKSCNSYDEAVEWLLKKKAEQR